MTNILVILILFIPPGNPIVLALNAAASCYHIITHVHLFTTSSPYLRLGVKLLKLFGVMSTNRMTVYSNVIGAARFLAVEETV